MRANQQVFEVYPLGIEGKGWREGGREWIMNLCYSVLKRHAEICVMMRGDGRNSAGV